MKIKKFFWGILIVLLIGTVVFLGSRFFAADKYLCALPAQPKALVSIDMFRLAEESGMNMEEARKLLLKERDMASWGIDWSKRLFAFISSKEYLGMLASVRSESDLEETFLQLQEKQVCGDIEERQGYRWTVLQDHWLVGFDDHAMLIMGPELSKDMNVLRQEMLKCFRQNEKESGKSSSLYTALMSRESGLSFISQLDILPFLSYNDTFKMGLPGHATLSDIYLKADMQLKPQALVVHAEVSSENPEINKYYEQITPIAGSMKGSFMHDVPTDALAWGSMNIDGEMLLEQLRKSSVVRTLLIGLNMGIDADMIIRSIQGDMAVTVCSLDEEADSSFVLAAQLKNKDFLNEVDYWKESALKQGRMKIRDLGNDRFYLTTENLHTYLGVEENILYLTPSEAMSRGSSQKKTDTLKEWEDEIASSRYFFWVNLYRLMQQPALKTMLGREPEHSYWLKKIQLFDELVIRSSDVYHVSLELNAPKGENIIKELLQ